METILALLHSYGPLLLLVLGFAEYAGVPIASVPFLVTAGALSGMGGIALPPAIAAAAGGGLLADATWYGLARWRGARLVGAACSLSSNQGACVLRVETRVNRLGPAYILVAKFLPGAGNLIAPAAGYGGLPAVKFLALDAAALALWATVYTGLGRLFAPQVESLIRIAETYTRWVITGGLALVALGALARYVKSRRHAHGRAPEPAKPRAAVPPPAPAT